MIKLNCLKSSIKTSQIRTLVFGCALSPWELGRATRALDERKLNLSLAADWDARSSRSQADFLCKKWLFLMLEFRVKIANQLDASSLSDDTASLYC